MILHFCRFASCTLVIRSLCAAIFEMMYELTGSSVQRTLPNSLDKPIQESWQLFASFLCRGSYHPQSTCFHVTFLCFYYRSKLVIAIWMSQPVLQGIGEWVNFDWAPIPKDAAIDDPRCLASEATQTAVAHPRMCYEKLYMKCLRLRDVSVGSITYQHKSAQLNITQHNPA